MTVRVQRLPVEAGEPDRPDRQHPLSPANERPVEYRPAERKCLKCNSDFYSEWSGERICKKCKGSFNWRSGLA